MATRKILYSPGFGAGWSSWSGGSAEFQKFMLTYQPLIDALERDEDLGDPQLNRAGDGWSDLHPALEQFLKDAKERFGEEPYIGGARDLRVATVSGPFRIDEYDGSERVIESSAEDYITLEEP